MPLVGITDYVKSPAEIETKALGEGYDFVFFDSEDETRFDSELLQKIDAMLVWHAIITEKTARQLKQCKIVVRYGIGFDVVDYKALKKHNIPFCNNPDYGTEEVADTACAMILNLQRKISLYNEFARHEFKNWQTPNPPLFRTSTQTVGIVGVGRIGTAVINRLKPFGYRVLGFDPYQPAGHEKGVGYTRCHSLQELLSESDFVSIHCPLNEETRNMIDESFVSRMKKGSAIINTARGGLLDNYDIIESALKNNALSAIAFDVLPEEPPSDHSLIRAWRDQEEWQRGRIIINPHTAFFSNEAGYEERFKAAETIKLYLEKDLLRNQIT